MTDSKTILTEQADRIHMLMLLARFDPQRFGLTACGLCRKPIEKLRGIGVFMPNDETARQISPKGKYRIVLFTLCPACEATGGEGIDDEIIRHLQIH